MRLFPIIIVLLFVSCTVSKNIETAEKESFKGTVHVDRFGDVYTITSNHEIVRHSKDLTEETFTYANNLIGKITKLDVANPQKLLAFAPDFGTIIYLDNTLSEISTLNLPSIGFTDVETVAMANDGNVWLHDAVNRRLVKITDEGEIVVESNRLTDYNMSESPSVYMLERENKVYLVHDDGSVYIFDNFGQYLKPIGMALPDCDKFTVSNGRLIYLGDDAINVYNLQTYEKKEMSLPTTVSDVVDMTWYDQKPIFVNRSGAVSR